MAAFALVGLVAWGAFALAKGPLFRIRDVTVSGAAHLTREQVISAAAVPSNATLLDLPGSRIVARLKAQPWVLDAHLDRDFPSTLRIVVEERTPAIVVDTGGADLWLVSADQMWLAKRSSEDTGVVVVSDIPSLKPAAGKKTASEELSNAIAIAEGISPELRSMTRVISAPTVEKTAIITDDDVEIFIGEATQLSTKDALARKILKEEHGKVVYINVRVVEHPTWRGLD